MEIYVLQNGGQIGPFSEASLSALLAGGSVRPDDSCWAEGMSGWVPIRTVLEKPSPAGAVLPGEHLFLETPLLKVTDKRIVSGAATFALSGVTSVQLRLQRRSLMTAIILVGASLYFLILGCVQHWALAAAAAFMVCTIIHFRRRKIRFEAVLVTSSGQLPAFTTPDRAAAVSFITAVNRAIVARG